MSDAQIVVAAVRPHSHYDRSDDDDRRDDDAENKQGSWIHGYRHLDRRRPDRRSLSTPAPSLRPTDCFGLLLLENGGHHSTDGSVTQNNERKRWGRRGKALPYKAHRGAENTEVERTFIAPCPL